MGQNHGTKLLTQTGYKYDLSLNQRQKHGKTRSKPNPNTREYQTWTKLELHHQRILLQTLVKANTD